MAKLAHQSSNLPFFADRLPLGIAGLAAASNKVRDGHEVEYRNMPARSILNRSESNRGLPFHWSINPYRGCEFACRYCYARYTHEFMELRDSVDFEDRIFIKDDAARLLRRDLHLVKPGDGIAIGTATDPYQPIERQQCVTRSLLEVLARCRHPVSIVTKSALIIRDLDLLADLAKDRLVSVMLSITSLDPDIKRTLEPRTASPQARLRVIEALAAANVPVGVMVAPVIPAITDHEMEDILAAAAAAGATAAGYVLLRLPHEVKLLFREWLAEHHPDRAKHVMSLMNQARGGKDYDAAFGRRMRGTGPYAEILRTRFELATRKLGLAASGDRHDLQTGLFRRPAPATGQLSLEL